MVNCQVLGFRQALCIQKSKAQAMMQDCVVDLSVGQAFSADRPVVRNTAWQLCNKLDDPTQFDTSVQPLAAPSDLPADYLGADKPLRAVTEPCKLHAAADLYLQ
jgi:hypothetical protein